MADVEQHGSASTPSISVNCALNAMCKFCTGYLSEIESLNTELQSARRIIQLLQDDLNGIKNQQPEREPTARLGSDVTNSWKTTATYLLTYLLTHSMEQSPS